MFMFWNSIVKHARALNATGAKATVALWAAVFFVTLAAPTESLAKEALPAQSASQTVTLADLPRQGRETYELILKGGPFAYDKDGTVFGNRERNLPAQKRGYYREYTVKTPYARNRGAKRIVCGGSQPAQPEACYYSDDHYASFKRITP